MRSVFFSVFLSSFLYFFDWRDTNGTAGWWWWYFFDMKYGNKWQTQTYIAYIFLVLFAFRIGSSIRLNFDGIFNDCSPKFDCFSSNCCHQFGNEIHIHFNFRCYLWMRRALALSIHHWHFPCSHSCCTVQCSVDSFNWFELLNRLKTSMNSFQSFMQKFKQTKNNFKLKVLWLTMNQIINERLTFIIKSGVFFSSFKIEIDCTLQLQRMKGKTERQLF